MKDQNQFLMNSAGKRKLLSRLITARTNQPARQKPCGTNNTIKPQTKGINKMLVQTYLQNLYERRYYKWLKNAEAVMGFDPSENPLNNPMVRLSMSVDYKRLYDFLLFETQHFLSLACFCKLAPCFTKHINQNVLDCELIIAQRRLRAIFNSNRGFENEQDIIDIFDNAYKSALLDLHLHHNIDLDVMEKHRFTLAELLNGNHRITLRSITL